MVISKAQEKNIDEQKDKHIHFKTEKDLELSSTVSDIRIKQKESVVEREAKKKGVHYINLKTFPLTQDALLTLDRAFCEKEKVVCFYNREEQLRLGALNPSNPTIVAKAQELEEKYRSHVTIYLISKGSLKIAFKKYDTIPKAVLNRDEGIELTEDILKEQQEKITSIKTLGEVIAKAPVTELLALLVSSALKSGASDIHIEAEADDIKIRMRIDGMLHDIGTLPNEAWHKVISRIKLLSGLKLNVADKPQDGRFTIYLSEDKIEVRVSTVPTSYGESVVMRLLRFSVEALAFEKLGIIGYTQKVLKREISKPNGMIIATGPTGSGKTTTLYSILHKLNDPSTKILTLEDPIEYKIKGINQTQINITLGLDFAKGLRSILRQDPDIIMVGEIRDLETADTAVNAALTGHLMLSTLHTNSAAGAIPRFLAMGSKSFLLAPSINAIVGQRLVRKLCEHCKKHTPLEKDNAERVREVLTSLAERKDLNIKTDLSKPENIKFFTAPGCDKCNGLGYSGRIGIFEILTINKELEKIILAGTVSEFEIQETAQKYGMVTMVQDGLLKAMEGITSIYEVFRQAD